VVTTPNAGLVVRDGVEGFVVPIRDVDALAGRIARLADDSALRTRMAEAARARALEFTWDAYRARISSWLETTAFSALISPASSFSK
jgi:glycosyltransferase involved in cell wall biosynthesis